MQMWRVTQGVCRTDGAEGCPVYGVQVTLPDGTVWSFADVDTDRFAAERLACRLQSLQPAPCHFADLVLDFIEEQAQKV